MILMHFVQVQNYLKTNLNNKKIINPTYTPSVTFSNLYKRQKKRLYQWQKLSLVGLKNSIPLNSPFFSNGKHLPGINNGSCQSQADLYYCYKIRAISAYNKLVASFKLQQHKYHHNKDVLRSNRGRKMK